MHHCTVIKPGTETGAFGVPKSFFTFSVICGGCVLGPLLFLERYLAVRTLINVENEILQKINLIAMYFGFMSTVGLAGVIAFPVSSIFWTHMLSAVAHFFFAMFYVLLQTYLTFCSPQVTELMKKVRYYLCGLIIIFCFVLVILLPVSFSIWNRENTHLPAVKKPGDKGFGLMVTTACVEWTMYGFYLLYLITFYSEFLCCKFFVGMTPKEDEE
ncbi:DNA damage-regulated autophagy modulator protein 1 [Trichonephila clavipes]|uniref:DNA damage-regulated autophagy modulator protein 1 n=1 Tax=Trichonephila clavipes TaxID=2585209 RepID=A0A8X6SA08_TRICX|nr:DNA damage-regulated autophagy modulator protein 1 [Trichonephila clavipes]